MGITNWNGKPFPREDVLAHVGEGWHPLVNKLIDDLFQLGWDGRLDQIKEKFGGLRFYISSGSPEVHERISKAEDDSYRICDVCGEPGKLRTGGWLATLCDTHGGKEDLEDGND